MLVIKRLINKENMKKLKFALILAVSVMLVGGSARAAEFLYPEDDSNDTVSTSMGEQHKDLYIGGGNVLVDSDTSGDLFVGGASVTVNGGVEKDLFVGGGNISLTGVVGDDLRVAGGNVTITSSISGDLIAAGGNIILTEGATIGGDLVVGGGNVTVNSPVGGDVKIGGGTVIINSTVSGSVDIRVKEQLVFGSNSVVRGQINFSGPKEAVVAGGAQVSTINFTKVSKHFNTRAFLGFGIVIDLIAWLIAALVLLALLKNRLKLGLRGIKDKPWLSLGIGVLGVIVVPAIVVILFASVVGYYLGLIVMSSYIVLVLVGLLLGSISLGSLVMMYINKASELPLDWVSVVVGVVLTKVLLLIPVVGWIIALILMLLGIGTMLRMAKYEIKRNREHLPLTN